MRNSPTAPPATDRPRNVQTGSSASAIFMIGQFSPQPSVRAMSNNHVERGRVCCVRLMDFVLLTRPGPGRVVLAVPMRRRGDPRRLLPDLDGIPSTTDALGAER